MAFRPAMQFPVEADGPGTGMSLLHPSLPVISEDIKRALAASHPRSGTRFFELQHRSATPPPERLLAILSGFFGILAAVLVMVGLLRRRLLLVTRRRNELAYASPWLHAPPDYLAVIAMPAHARHWTIVGQSSLARSAGAGSISSAETWDPASLGFAVALLAAVAVVASFLPAFRAARLTCRALAARIGSLHP